MEKKLSKRILNALNTEVKNIDIIEILTDMNKSTRRDVLRLTGLRLKDYNVLVEEVTDRDFRGFLCDCSGTRVLSRHVKREDLTPVQKAVSKLLWKWQNEGSMLYISEMYHCITGRFLEDDFWDEEVFDEETYNITEEELEEVARIVLEYVKEINQTA
jgi:hypothetical protein